MSTNSVLKLLVLLNYQSHPAHQSHPELTHSIIFMILANALSPPSFNVAMNSAQLFYEYDSDMCATLLASAPVTGDVFTISFEPSRQAYLACQIVAGLFSPSPPVRQPAVRYHLFARHQPGQTYTLHSTPIRRHAFAKTGNTWRHMHVEMSTRWRRKYR